MKSEKWSSFGPKTLILTNFTKNVNFFCPTFPFYQDPIKLYSGACRHGITKISKYVYYLGMPAHHASGVNPEGVEEAGVEVGVGPAELKRRGSSRVVNLPPHHNVLRNA